MQKREGGREGGERTREGREGGRGEKEGGERRREGREGGRQEGREDITSSPLVVVLQ